MFSHNHPSLQTSTNNSKSGVKSCQKICVSHYSPKQHQHQLTFSLAHLPVASRSLTDISRVPSLFVRFVVTRSRLSSSSASSPSSAWSAKSHKTSSPTSASSHPPSVLFRSPSRLTSSPSSRTPICAPSTPSVSPSSPRTSSLPAAFVVSDHR